MRMLTVGQMAGLNHVSEQTLRLYDKLGLLSPHARGENGYRYYDVKQSAVLDIIQYMKSLGISLKDIKRQLDAQNLASIEVALHEKQKQTEQEIRALKCQRRALERTIESIERYRSAPPDGTIQMEYIAARQMYVVDSGVNFYDHDIETYEGILRELRDSLMKDHLPQIYFCNAGTILSKQYFLDGVFISTRVFVFVDREFVEDQTLITSIPSGNYACIYCDDFYKEKEYASRLKQYIYEQNCETCGDYLCEAFADVPVAAGRGERGMYLRLQIPVHFR